MAAEYMSQEEITALLSQVNSSAELNAEITDETVPHGDTVRYSEKVFRYKEPPLAHSSSEYRSPVIKSDKVNFNPHLNGNSVERDNGQVEVYSLEEYKLLKK